MKSLSALPRLNVFLLFATGSIKTAEQIRKKKIHVP